MSRARRIVAAGLVALLGGALAASAQTATRLYLHPVTSMFEHLEAGRFGPVRGVCYDRWRDEVWVADPQNDLLAVFDRDGIPLHTARPGGNVVRPFRVAVAPDGSVLVLDEDHRRVAQLDWRGEMISDLELPGLTPESNLTAITIDADGNLYLGDSAAGQVLVYGPDRRLRLRFGERGTGRGELTAIAGIAADARRIVVVDSVGIPVQVFSRRGEWQRGFGAHTLGVENFSLPAGVTLDAEGRIIVLDSIRQEIKVFDADGRFLDRFGGGGPGPGSVYFPEDVATDGRGRLYVAERANRRVQVFDELELPVPARQRRAPRRSWRR